MVSDTDPIQSRAPRMEVHCPATLRRAWGQVSGESVSAGVFHASVARVWVPLSLSSSFVQLMQAHGKSEI